jgi:hypothetical protein
MAQTHMSTWPSIRHPLQVLLLAYALKRWWDFLAHLDAEVTQPFALTLADPASLKPVSVC